MPRKVHFVPGWAEGSWHFKQFARAFDQGYLLCRDSSEADIVIAHSSGCYSLPPLSGKQLIVLVDPPYWPDRNISVCVAEHVILDISKQMKNYGTRFYLRLRFWNLVYLTFEPWRHIKLWRSLQKTLDLSLNAKNAIFIRDSNDAYCGPGARAFVRKHPGIKFVEISGLHESCWASPESYLAAIEEAYNS